MKKNMKGSMKAATGAFNSVMASVGGIGDMLLNVTNVGVNASTGVGYSSIAYKEGNKGKAIVKVAKQRAKFNRKVNELEITQEQISDITELFNN